MASRVIHDQEREVIADFTRQWGDDEYRAPLAWMLGGWGDANKEHFGGQLTVPHLGIGDTPPRSLAVARKNTNYGGRMQFTFNSRLFFGPDKALIPRHRDGTRRNWSAEGAKRFLEDYVLRLTTWQFVREKLQADEPSYGGYGPRYAEEANRIGIRVGLGPVVAKHRGTETEQETWPLARGWPHNCRIATYYGDDVTEHALELACGPSGSIRIWRPAAGQAVLEMIAYLLRQNRSDDALRLVERRLEWLRALRESHWPPRRKVENGKEDVDGTALGTVSLDSNWLNWNDGTVQRIARAIKDSNTYGDLPILADALEEAGCQDGRILRHLRERMEHTRRCWVLGLLLALGGE